MTTAMSPDLQQDPCIPSTGEQQRLELVKATLLCQGAVLDPSAASWLDARFPGAATAHEYATTGGLTMDLGHGVLVNAPVDEWFCAASSARICADDDGLAIELMGQLHPVHGVLPLPGYLDAVAADGNPVTGTCFTHADRIRLSPIVGCAYSCDYCDLPSERYLRRDPQQLIAALDVALVDAALTPRHILVSGGSPGPRHVDWFEDVIAQIVRASCLPVDVMMSAVPDRADLVDRLVDHGVQGFSINLELHSDAASLVHIRGKHRHARPGFEAFVGRAVARLGRRGSVRSLIIAGLESPEETRAGIDLIASLGADPVLSPFRPAQRTSLEHHRPPETDQVLELLDQAREITARHGVHLGPGCVPCQHNTLAFPWDR